MPRLIPPNSVSGKKRRIGTTYIIYSNTGRSFQLNDVYKSVGWHQLRRLCGFHLDASDDDRTSVVDQLCRLYVESIKFVGTFSPTELRPHDFYVVLAGQLLWQMWTSSSSSSSSPSSANDKHFWKAVLILQAALKKSPANYHLRFLLIKFFNQAGKSRFFPLRS